MNQQIKLCRLFHLYYRELKQALICPDYVCVRVGICIHAYADPSIYPDTDILTCMYLTTLVKPKE